MKLQFDTPDRFAKTKTASSTVVVIVSAAEAKRQTWLENLPEDLAARARLLVARKKSALEAGARLAIPATDAKDEDAWLVIVPEKTETFHLLEFARDSLSEAVSTETKALTLILTEDDHAVALADAFGSALAARVFLMPVYGERAKKRKPYALKSATLVAPTREAESAFERGHALGEGTNIARELATLPPNVLDPQGYGARIKELARKHRLSVRFHSNKELKRMGAGAFTAVDQANPASKGGIWEVSYAGKGAKNKKPVNLVGKGMCFDTGGYDVKVSGGMRTMKGDMQGSAVALATLITASTLKLPLKMKAFLAVTENHISPVGYKPDDVVTALNGLTIEIVNTDAEGRMVLADTLTLASREAPECVIDFATLTGSAVRSIGTKFSVGLTNRKELHAPIIDAGEKSGERVWTFPLDSTYFKALKSDIADTLQCTSRPGPDHIYAACFLSRFLKDGTPWVHIDLSASENDGGLAHVDSMFTGFGVRWAHEFLKRFV